MKDQELINRFSAIWEKLDSIDKRLGGTAETKVQIKYVSADPETYIGACPKCGINVIMLKRDKETAGVSNKTFYCSNGHTFWYKKEKTK